jgi:hypothetical protein
MTTIKRYSVQDIENIIFNGIAFKLSDDTIKMISELANQVGAVDYIKTPQFPKKIVENAHSNSHKSHIFSKGGKHKNIEIKDEDWDAIRNFQATEIKKREGIDANIDTIRKHLNKLTEKNYDKLLSQIKNEMNPLLEHFTASEFEKIGDSIFGIASGNAFYSNVYAKLYKNLMDEFDFMKTILDSRLNTFLELFTTIEYCNPNDNYDKFCENNKINEKRRALTTFYVNLMKEGVIEQDNVINIIKHIQTLIFEKINQSGNKEIVDEISENMYILVVNSYSDLNEHSDWDDIVSNVETISKYKVKDYPSITTKTVFKCMDILDELN